MPIHYKKDEKFLLDGDIVAIIMLEKNIVPIVVLLMEAKPLTINCIMQNTHSYFRYILSVMVIISHAPGLCICYAVLWVTTGNPRHLMFTVSLIASFSFVVDLISCTFIVALGSNSYTHTNTHTIQPRYVVVYTILVGLNILCDMHI